MTDCSTARFPERVEMAEGGTGNGVLKAPFP